MADARVRRSSSSHAPLPPFTSHGVGWPRLHYFNNKFNRDFCFGGGESGGSVFVCDRLIRHHCPSDLVNLCASVYFQLDSCFCYRDPVKISTYVVLLQYEFVFVTLLWAPESPTCHCDRCTPLAADCGNVG